MASNQQSKHGVFLRVFDVGLLLIGKAGIGKSSLALELIERGHALVSDDNVQFTINPEYESSGESRVIGKSPYILKDLLAVRDLGVLNIAQLFSKDRCVEEWPLDLIIELVDSQIQLATTLSGIQAHLSLLNHQFPLQQVHAHPKRNLALIIETAVKNYILRKDKNDAATLLQKRQQKYINKPL
jgi:HPr kinase/phosphorylase